MSKGLHKWVRRSFLKLLREDGDVSSWAGTDANGTVRVYSRPAPPRAVLTATPESYRLAIVDWNLDAPRAKETTDDVEIVTVVGQVLLVAVGDDADEAVEDGYAAFEAALKPRGTVTLDNAEFTDGATCDVWMGGLVGPVPAPDQERAPKFQGMFNFSVEAKPGT